MRKIYCDENGLPDVMVDAIDGLYSLYDFESRYWISQCENLNGFANEGEQFSEFPLNRDMHAQYKTAEAARNFIQEMNNI